MIVSFLPAQLETPIFIVYRESLTRLSKVKEFPLPVLEILKRCMKLVSNLIVSSPSVNRDAVDHWTFISVQPADITDMFGARGAAAW